MIALRTFVTGESLIDVAEEKKIFINFNKLSKDALEAIERETLGARRLPGSVMDMSETDQIGLLRDMALGLRADKKALRRRPDFAKVVAGKTIDEQYEAIQALTPETSDFWEKIGEKQKALKDLKFHLYLQSPYPDVRLRMMRDVDRVIAKEFTARNTGNVTDHFWHDLLYLSTFGGKITRDRQDVWGIAYEFNVQAKGQKKPAVPWNPMETLFEAGMTRVYDAETTENNLTPLGNAVLVRMNELHGKAKAQKQYRPASAGMVKP